MGCKLGSSKHDYIEGNHSTIPKIESKQFDQLPNHDFPAPVGSDP